MYIQKSNNFKLKSQESFANVRIFKDFVVFPRQLKKSNQTRTNKTAEQALDIGTENLFKIIQGKKEILAIIAFLI